MNNDNKDYARLVAAQNEATRRLKIKSIQNNLTDEQKRKNMYATISGICFAGALVATHFSGVDPNTAIATEIQAINSMDALKDYLATFTPAMWLTLTASVSSFFNFLKHRKKYNEANREFYDMMDTEPENYQDIVENQAKSK